jgi:hypothetical protein
VHIQFDADGFSVLHQAVSKIDPVNHQRLAIAIDFRNFALREFATIATD